MNAKAKIFTGAVALTLAASAVLTASSASARPHDDDRYNNGYERGKAEWKRERAERYRDRYEDERLDDRDDNWRYSRKNVYVVPAPRYRIYPGTRVVRLPDGCRRVVYRDRTYYTRDNNVYYSYDPVRRGFVVVNVLGLKIGF